MKKIYQCLNCQKLFTDKEKGIMIFPVMYSFGFEQEKIKCYCEKCTKLPSIIQSIKSYDKKSKVLI